jgi:hydrogenase/urease accessory protein HupE
VGIRHTRALIVALLIAAPLRAHEIGTMRVNVVFHRDHTWTARVFGAARFVPAAVDARFDGVKSATPLIPPNAKTFTWRYLRAHSTYALTLVNEGQPPLRQWIEGDSMSQPFALSRSVVPPAGLETVRQYLALGFTHIIPEGLDHILFVLGMFLLTKRARDVLAQVTAFTVAHSITLGLAMYGLVSVSPRVVEPAIALSIAYIAIENVVATHVKPWRVAVVFCFGLLHGMGFAGALNDLGLPRTELLPALVSFNVGVELGQLTVIAAAFALFAYWWRGKTWYRARFVVPASSVIGVVGLFWAVQRVL